MRVIKNQAIIIVVIALLLIGGVAYFASQSSAPAPTDTNTQTTNPTQAPQGTESGNVSPAAEVKTFEITGKPFEFSLKEITVKRGDTVRIVFTNAQGMHDWVVDEFNARTKQIQAGQTDTVEFVADQAGTFEYYCSVGNHRQQGMVGNLVVEE